MSKIVPSAVHTGVWKGCRETAQKLKGSRLNVPSGALDLAMPEPALAEYASSDAHSEWVIWKQIRKAGGLGRRAEFAHV